MGTRKFIIDGHEVTVSFASQENREALHRVKQILLSAYTAKENLQKNNCTFAAPEERRDNVVGSNSPAP